ncbi:MAG: hypothetical protein JSU68_09505 [Phycisphaerales bacterium]|nr:MAG: hypothetical protein JSU68_09505 [Phycisphaerales bacterium]
MTAMYQVYAQQKAGRPTLALVASAGLLAGSVLLALGVITIRRRVPDTELGERFSLGDWNISVRCPAGWSPGGRALAPSGFVFVENRRGGGRQIQLRRFEMEAFNPPSQFTRPDTLARIFGLPPAALEGAFRDLGREPFGPIPGSLVSVGSVVIHLGVAPGGTVYWAMMDNPSPVTPGDIRLLRDVTASIELLNPPMTDDPSVLWAKTSFRFLAPREARFAPGSHPDSVICFADPGKEAVWHVVARKTFLAPGRESASLVRDYVSRASDGQEPASIEEGGDEQSRFARGQLARVDHRDLTQSVAVRALGGGQAVMLVGTAEADSESDLLRAEQTILRTLRPTGETEDLTPALERGRRLAARVARDVAELWPNQDREWWYLIMHDETARGFQRVARRTGTLEGRSGFIVDSAYHYQPTGDALYQGRSAAFLPHEGGIVAMRAQGWERDEGGAARWKLAESRDENEATLLHEWSNERNEEVSRRMPIGDPYLPDPLPEWAFFVVASEARAEESFLFSTSGYPLVHDVFWMRAEPIGPGQEESRGRGLGARVIKDFDPEPQRWYFDPQGNLTELYYGGRQSLIAVPQRQVFARFPEAGGILAEIDARWNRP